MDFSTQIDVISQGWYYLVDKFILNTFYYGILIAQQKQHW